MVLLHMRKLHKSNIAHSVGIVSQWGVEVYRLYLMPETHLIINIMIIINKNSPVEVIGYIKKTHRPKYFTHCISSGPQKPTLQV